MLVGTLNEAQQPGQLRVGNSTRITWFQLPPPNYHLELLVSPFFHHSFSLCYDQAVSPKKVWPILL